jgi:hypothetical protein
MQEDFPETKIIVVTALPPAWICPEDIKVEATLRKPFALDELRTALRKALDGEGSSEEDAQ